MQLHAHKIALFLDLESDRMRQHLRIYVYSTDIHVNLHKGLDLEIEIVKKRFMY